MFKMLTLLGFRLLFQTILLNLFWKEKNLLLASGTKKCTVTNYLNIFFYWSEKVVENFDRVESINSHIIQRLFLEFFEENFLIHLSKRNYLTFK